jgi:hypothetical protein
VVITKSASEAPRKLSNIPWRRLSTCVGGETLIALAAMMPVSFSVVWVWASTAEEVLDSDLGPNYLTVCQRHRGGIEGGFEINNRC